MQANGKPDRSEPTHSGGNNPRKKIASKKFDFSIFYDLFIFKNRETRVWQINPCKKIGKLEFGRKCVKHADAGVRPMSGLTVDGRSD